MFAVRLMTDNQQISVDVDLLPYDKQFHDDYEHTTEHDGFTSKGSYDATTHCYQRHVHLANYTEIIVAVFSRTFALLSSATVI